MTRGMAYWILATGVLCLGSLRASAECASFYDGLNELAALLANGGSVNGSANFVAGVNDLALEFNGATSVSYPPVTSTDQAGSISLWFKPSTGASDGGLLQVGELGQPNSIGLFYVNQCDLVFETRNASGGLTAINAPGVLSTSKWTHIVATWQDINGGRHMWLFVDGYYVTYGYAAGTYDHSAADLRIGYTGYWEYGQGAIDELRLFDWPLSDTEQSAEYVYSSNRHRRQPTGKPISTGPVQIVGQHLLVNGKPFKVKGVGYQATPIGAYPWIHQVYTDAAILARDLPILEAMNINTIRTWAQPPNTMLLDAIYNLPAEPIYAMIGFWVPNAGVDYADPVFIAQIESDFRSFIRQFKDHPAVLGWLLGNEVNLSLSGQTLADWYALANHLAQVAYEEEGAAYHPTILVNAVGDFGDVEKNSDDISLNFVDMWGHNAYFGWDAHCYFEYHDLVSAKPLVLTEFGVDAWNTQADMPYPQTQAEYEVHQWRQIESACVGGTIMAYSDEWWKDMAIDQPAVQDFGGYGTRFHPDGYSNEEWYGVVEVQDNGSGPDIIIPRQAYYDLAAEFAYEPGDVDQDDDVDIADAAALQICAGSGSAGVCGIAFDIEVDDEIDGLDFQRLIMMLNGPDTSPSW